MADWPGTLSVDKANLCANIVITKRELPARDLGSKIFSLFALNLCWCYLPSNLYNGQQLQMFATTFGGNITKFFPPYSINFDLSDNHWINNVNSDTFLLTTNWNMWTVCCSLTFGQLFYFSLSLTLSFSLILTNSTL